MTDLLRVTDLVKLFPARGGMGAVRAVDGVSLTLRRGETLGIVGESGCGKSTLGRAILRLIEPNAGEIVFDGTDLRALGQREMRALRREMQIIFQDPFASLDPRLKIGAIIAEPLAIHGVGNRASRRQTVLDLLETVGLDAEAAERYPHEFSGGQRQRIGIARALALRPKLIIADEPVSALDVSIQSQILNLLAELKQRFGLSYILISHDLAVVEHLSDTIAVMYLGRIVETARAEEIFARPSHPYTQALISAVPRVDSRSRTGRIALSGEMPNPDAPPAGCPFHPRCPKAMDVCRTSVPAARGIADSAELHLVRCHLYPDANRSRA